MNKETELKIEIKMESLIEKVDASLLESKNTRKSFTSFSRWIIGIMLMTFSISITGQTALFIRLQEKISQIETKVCLLWDESIGMVK